MRSPCPISVYRTDGSLGWVRGLGLSPTHQEDDSVASTAFAKCIAFQHVLSAAPLYSQILGVLGGGRLLRHKGCFFVLRGVRVGEILCIVSFRALWG